MTIVTPENHGPLVNVAMWMILGPMVIVASVKVWTKWESIRRVQEDDILMILSMILAIAQSVATTEQVRNGLGRKKTNLKESQLNAVYLCEYIAQLLYVVTIYTTKLIGLVFYKFLLVDPRSQKSIIKASILFVLLWMTISLFVLSFRCHPPHTWLLHSGGCIDISAFWVINTIVDISTQLLISFLPTLLLRKLHANRSKKMLSMFAFTPNLLTIPLSIIRLVYFFESRSSNNYVWDSVNFAMLTALHAILGVLIAGLPFSKPVVDSIALVPIVITEDPQGYSMGRYANATKESRFGSLQVQSHKRSRDREVGILSESNLDTIELHEFGAEDDIRD